MADWPKQQSELPFVWYRTPFGKLMIAAPILCVLVVVLLVFGASSWREACDLDAQKRLEKLEQAIERLANEMVDLDVKDMPTRLSSGLTEDRLRFMIGPYYGWSGTIAVSRERDGGDWKFAFHCKTLIKLTKDEIRSCAVRGSRTGSNESNRRIYRIGWPSMKPLEPTVGPCSGREYGFGGVYLESILNSDGSWTKPSKVIHHGGELSIDTYESYVASGLIKE